MRLKLNKDSSLWRQPGYLAWLTTDTTFAVSASINGFVLSLLVISTTGSASQAGVVSAINMTTAGILHLFGGWVQDVYDRRKIALWNGITGIILYSTAIVLLWTNTFSFVTASALAFALGIRGGICANVTNVMLRAFLPSRILPKAISVNQARDALIEFGISPVAGALLQLGRVVPYTFNVIFNALGLIASLRLPASISEKVPHQDAADKRFSLQSALAGFNKLLSVRLLRIMATSGNIMFTIFNAMIMATIWHLVKVTGNAAIAGLTNSLVAVGVFIGAALAPRLAARVRGGVIVLIGYFLPFACITSLLTFHSSSWHFLLLTPAMFLLPAGSAVLGSLQLLVVPNENLGRAFAAIGILELIFNASVMSATGFCYEHWGYTNTLITGIVIMGLCLLHLALVPELRRIPRADDLEAYAQTLQTTQQA